MCGFTRRESQQQAERLSRELQGALHERDTLRSRCLDLEMQLRMLGDGASKSRATRALVEGREDSGSAHHWPSAAASAAAAEEEESGQLWRTEAALRQALQESEADRARLRTQHTALSRRLDASKQELEERTESAAHLLRELEASMYQVRDLRDSLCPHGRYSRWRFQV